MIEEVVSSILQAEDVAAQKIEAAKQTASDIVSSAEAEADKFKKQTSARNKEVFVEGMQHIEHQTVAIFHGTLAELNAQADKEMTNYEKNVDKAVKIILEHLK